MEEEKYQETNSCKYVHTDLFSFVRKTIDFFARVSTYFPEEYFVKMNFFNLKADVKLLGLDRRQCCTPNIRHDNTKTCVISTPTRTSPEPGDGSEKDCK